MPTAEDRVLRELAREGIHISDGEITLLMNGIRMLQDDRIYRVKDGILHDEPTVNGLIARWQQAIRRKNE
ncbi:hypothetical protein GI479_23410 [Salmonella enterica]|nr:hypothetical protein [Salmonella enterica]EEM4809911.1 hypothetical protein [Salmonella enterica]